MLSEILEHPIILESLNSVEQTQEFLGKQSMSIGGTQRVFRSVKLICHNVMVQMCYHRFYSNSQNVQC